MRHPATDKRARLRFHEILGLARQHFPDILERVEGIAEGESFLPPPVSKTVRLLKTRKEFMSRRKVPPEAQIIALFSGLSDENKRMVMFGLNAMMAQSLPKSSSPAPDAPRRSSSKKESKTAPVQSSLGDAGNALNVSNGIEN